MQVVLANQPLLSEGHDPSFAESLQSRELKAPPLGSLVAAALFRNAGSNVALVDLNHLYVQAALQGDSRTFRALAADHLVKAPADLLGFSTICSSYHLTLLIARDVKARRSGTRILLGGPQATASARATLEACPWVDQVLCGEVEESLELFVQFGLSAPERVPGLAWRRRDGAVVCNPTLPAPPMSAVPLPAYDLWVRPRFATLMLEVGRGCPFDCKFCSTKSFFGRKYRVKAVEQLLEEAAFLTGRHGCVRAVLVHDHLGASRHSLVQLCEAWSSHETLKSVPWTCSLRADAISEEVAAALKQGGCDGAFVGLETGSQRMQKLVNKRLRLDRVDNALGHLSSAGVEHNVSFIAGYPEETREDLNSTIELYGRQILRPLARPQIATLSPLPGSRYFDECKDRLELRSAPSDIASKGDNVPAEIRYWMADNPELFGAHFSLPLEHLDYQFVIVTVQFLKYSTALFRWTLASGMECAGGLWELVRHWWEFCGNSVAVDDREYYESGGFRADFFRFMRLVPGITAADKQRTSRHMALVDAHDISPEMLVALHESQAVCIRELTAPPEGVPVLAPRCIRIALSYSYTQLVSALCNGKPPDDVPPHPSSVLVVAVGDRIQLRQVSPLALALVQAFERGATFDEAVCAHRGRLAEHLPVGVNVEDAAELAVQELLESGLLGVVPTHQSQMKSNP